MRTTNIISAEITAKKTALTKAIKAYNEDTTSTQNKDAVDKLKDELVVLEVERDQVKTHLKQQKEENKLKLLEETNKIIATTHYDLIEEHNVVQIIGTESFFIKQGNEWLERNLTKLSREIFSFKNKADENIFFDVMRGQNRNYNFTTFEFGECHPKLFNLAQAVEEQWLQIGDFEGMLTDYVCPPAIDILMNSISAGNPKARLHLEECIIRKRRHPGDYKLPSLLAYGQGGAGRNEFVTDLLSVIFKKACAVTNFKTLVDNPFMLLGKVIVLCDETISSQASYEKFKSIAGNKTLLMKKLFQDVYLIPNVMWLHISGNGLNGPLAITNDSTTRRLSAIKYSKDLLQWLGEYLGEEFTGDKEQASKFNEIWIKMKTDDFTDEKVGQWLNYLNAKFPVDRPVPAYHEEDFNDMVTAHEGPIETIIKEVLLADYDNKPVAIRLSTLFSIYKLMLKENFGGRRDQGKNKFYGSIKTLAERGIKGWRYVERQTWKHEGQRGDAPMMVQDIVTGPVEQLDDPDLYIKGASTGFPTGLENWLINSNEGDTMSQIRRRLDINSRFV